MKPSQIFNSNFRGLRLNNNSNSNSKSNSNGTTSSNNRNNSSGTNGNSPTIAGFSRSIPLGGDGRKSPAAAAVVESNGKNVEDKITNSSASGRSTPYSSLFSPRSNANATGTPPSNEANRENNSAVTAGRDDTIIIGVDFGTTYSGVAAALSGAPDDIEVIKSWPGGSGITSDKVPSELGYTVTNDKEDLFAPTQPSKVKWGFQFKPDEPRLRCLKLFLDRSQRLPAFVSAQATAAQLKRFDKTVVDAVADFLRELHTFTLQALRQRWGDAFVNNAIERSTNKGADDNKNDRSSSSSGSGGGIRVVLTVPAVWSDAAKHATLVAAEKAGMGKVSELFVVSEPEAAAMYTFKTLQPNHLQQGDNIIVCDAGGGTVDLIAYHITSMSPLKVEESAVGTGGLCGSAFLNYRFEDHVKKRLGDTVWKTMKPKTWSIALKYFEEYAKRNFNEDSDEDINIPFPGLADNEEAGLDCGFLTMSTSQTKSIIEPVVQDVIKLVEDQVKQIQKQGGLVKGIILVGGFGQSSHMYKCIKEHFNPKPQTHAPTSDDVSVQQVVSQKSHAIEVMQPIHSWTAVVRGAVLRGLEHFNASSSAPQVVSRIVRLHYGTSYATLYDPAEHKSADKYWSPLWERWMISDRISYHVSKGSVLTEPVSFHYTRNFRPGQSLIVQDDLYACALDDPPDTCLDESLIKVCTLTTDLGIVPKELFTRLTTSKGIVFENLDFALSMSVQSAELKFELMVDGVKYGSVEAEFY